MSSVVAWADLKSRVEAAGIALAGVPVTIVWPNQRAASIVPPFLLVEMTGGSSRPMHLGGASWLAEGQAFVHVMVKVGTGVEAVWNLVDQVEAMFRGPPNDTVVYQQVTTDPGGPGSDDGNYWRTSVTADWHLQTQIQRN